MRRYYISQRFFITLCVGITFRNVYYIMRFNTRSMPPTLEIALWLWLLTHHTDHVEGGGRGDPFSGVESSIDPDGRLGVTIRWRCSDLASNVNKARDEMQSVYDWNAFNFLGTCHWYWFRYSGYCFCMLDRMFSTVKRFFLSLSTQTGDKTIKGVCLTPASLQRDENANTQNTHLVKMNRFI